MKVAKKNISGREHPVRVSRWFYCIVLYIVAVIFVLPALSNSLDNEPFHASQVNTIALDGDEDGTQRTGREEIFIDTESIYTFRNIDEAYDKGKFKPLPGAGSTGLVKGSIWSHFLLKNTESTNQTYYLEYIDHQLIELTAYSRSHSQETLVRIADLSLARPFKHRSVSHNRFVFTTTIEPGQTREYYVKFGSDEAGFTFPSMRIWNEENLRRAQNAETSLITFLIGGFFLMSLFSLLAGVVIKEKTFYLYSLYAFSKIAVWATVLGFLHQYVVTENYHWSFKSICGAFAIACGLLFSRIFLQTKVHTPILDRVLLFMIINAVALLIFALFRAKALAVISITIALLLYPTMSIVGFIRWRQGSKEALAFSFAWTLLVIGLFVQALRDLGYVEHNLINYYWPAVASFFEMLGIMIAMVIMVQQLRIQKDNAEKRYLDHLELSKSELENLVKKRTRELEQAKSLAEFEARTDALTGINNRRSFFNEADERLNHAKMKGHNLSLLMFDIDHFKKINDTYGHAVGDEALRQFCKALSEHIRDKDIFGRLGGEEFALLLGEDRHGALHTAQRLQTVISEIEIETDKKPLRFTVSIGIAHLQSDEDTLEELLVNADNALYAAKEEGRNQIIESACPVDGFAAKNG